MLLRWVHFRELLIHIETWSKVAVSVSVNCRFTARPDATEVLHPLEHRNQLRCPAFPHRAFDCECDFFVHHFVFFVVSVSHKANKSVLATAGRCLLFYSEPDTRRARLWSFGFHSCAEAGNPFVPAADFAGRPADEGTGGEHQKNVGGFTHGRGQKRGVALLAAFDRFPSSPAKKRSCQQGKGVTVRFFSGRAPGR